MSGRCEFRAASADVTRWRVAAASGGISLAQWIRDACNAVTDHARAEIDAIVADVARKRRR